MFSGINLPAVYIANLLSVMLCLMTIVGNRWKVSGSDKEKKILRTMLVMTVISAVVDSTIFALDGRPGMLNFLILYIGNFWLFLSIILIGPAWLVLVIVHVDGHLDKSRKNILNVVTAVNIAILCANPFLPYVFTIDENNVYTRGPVFWLYLVIVFIMIIEGTVAYLRAKKQGGVLQFFPVWQFLMPIVIGIMPQCIFYGVSTIWASLAVGLSGMMNCLQSEEVYRDHLTGIYNRSYLDLIRKELMQKRSGTIAAMMLDLNRFKSINDTYGHLVGDEALIRSARIIRESVGQLGSAIRYAGDEFLVLLNTDDPQVVEDCAKRIQDRMDEFNHMAGVRYELSVSLGYTITDLKEKTVDQVMNDIDARMYENKKKYYSENPAKERRHR